MPHPSVVTLGAPQSRLIGVQSSQVRGVMGGKYSQDAALEDLMQNSLLKNEIPNRAEVDSRSSNPSNFSRKSK